MVVVGWGIIVTVARRIFICRPILFIKMVKKVGRRARIALSSNRNRRYRRSGTTAVTRESCVTRASCTSHYLCFVTLSTPTYLLRTTTFSRGYQP